MTASHVIAGLRALALDLRWTWSHEADGLWKLVDPALWEETRSPWTMLQHLPTRRLAALARDRGFVAQLNDVLEKRRLFGEQETWFDRHPHNGLGKIAYFSMEFGLGGALPLYAGGLGVLAGDYLKSASDVGAPLIGVGLLYQEGYFRQTVDAAGVQHEAYPFNDPTLLPIEPVMVDGAWLRVEVGLPGRMLHVRVWHARVGRVPLYLLDTNDLINSPADRGITSKLYGGGAELRLTQELVLGVGGWRALKALGHEIAICHLNEGHAAFAVLERAIDLATSQGLSLQEALWASRAGNVFTTHTPVEAGFDRFEPDLIGRYLAAVWPAASLTELMAFGQADPNQVEAPLNTAYLAVRGSSACFAVSQLHEKVSRRIFQPLYPRCPEAETPIGHITNGVHTPSWDSAGADQIWTDACTKERWRGLSPAIEAQILAVPDDALWAMRGEGRRRLVEYVRHRLSVQLGKRGKAGDATDRLKATLDPNILTLGFARRFTDYKRPNLLLRDEERLARLLLNPQRPVQIVVAGKAHPQDEAGKAMIQAWAVMAERPDLRNRLVFLEDYDITLAQELVQGVDVWLNTPRRPWEACGTSGMKVLVNGGLNCSVLDGWWDEAYQPDLGWCIGNGGGEEGPDVDAAEAAHTYDLLEHQITPEFYRRDGSGLPHEWLSRIRNSMARLTPAFSGARMVRDYVEQAYLPASASLKFRAKDDYLAARDLAAWARRLRRDWSGIHIGVPSLSQVKDGWMFAVPVMLGDLGSDDVQVELYADATTAEPAHCIVLRPEHAVPGEVNSYVYGGLAPLPRSAGDFTVRIRPNHAGVRIPAELELIAWQK